MLTENRHTERPLHLPHWSLSLSNMAHMHLTYLADVVYRHKLTLKNGILVRREDWTWMTVPVRGTSLGDVQVYKLGLLLEKDARSSRKAKNYSNYDQLKKERNISRMIEHFNFTYQLHNDVKLDLKFKR